MKKLSGTLLRSARRVAYGTVDRVALRPARRIGQILRDTRAVTSIEFAAIALPFFTLIMGTMAIGLWFFSAAAMDVAVYGAARQIQTGRLNSGLSGLSPGQLASNYICANITQIANHPIIPCDQHNPQMAMAVVGNFLHLLNKHKVTPAQNGNPEVDYWTLGTINTPTLCIPGTGQVVYLQATYTLPVFGAVITYFGGTPLISGTTVQVEQTPGAPSGTCSAL
jgi:TadE-like protein